MAIRGTHSPNPDVIRGVARIVGDANARVNRKASTWPLTNGSSGWSPRHTFALLSDTSSSREPVPRRGVPAYRRRQALFIHDRGV